MPVSFNATIICFRCSSRTFFVTLFFFDVETLFLMPNFSSHLYRLFHLRTVASDASKSLAISAFEIAKLLDASKVWQFQHLKSFHCVFYKVQNLVRVSF